MELYGGRAALEMDAGRLLRGAALCPATPHDAPDFRSQMSALLDCRLPRDARAPITAAELGPLLLRGSTATALDELPRSVLQHMAGYGCAAAGALLGAVAVSEPAILLRTPAWRGAPHPPRTPAPCCCPQQPCSAVHPHAVHAPPVRPRQAGSRRPASAATEEGASVATPEQSASLAGAVPGPSRGDGRVQAPAGGGRVRVHGAGGVLRVPAGGPGAARRAGGAAAAGCLGQLGHGGVRRRLGRVERLLQRPLVRRREPAEPAPARPGRLDAALLLPDGGPGGHPVRPDGAIQTGSRPGPPRRSAQWGPGWTVLKRGPPCRSA